MPTYDEIRRNAEINAYISAADRSLASLGFTEHSFAHVGRVADTAAYILEILDCSEYEIELVKIAAHLHDIGNLVNRIAHSQSGALMAFRILGELGMNAEDLATVVAAIGNHDEGTGVPVDRLSAALILADKSDVRRSRVRNRDKSSFDIHDRVNYSVYDSALKISEDKTVITLSLSVDTEYSSVMDFFEIFMQRMQLCRKAGEKLGRRCQLIINVQQLI